MFCPIFIVSTVDIMNDRYSGYTIATVDNVNRDYSGTLQPRVTLFASLTNIATVIVLHCYSEKNKTTK